jgi:DNA topoisomerase VI subunit A
MALIKVRELRLDIPKEAKILAERMLSDLEKSKRPYLEAVKTSLDNSEYNSKTGYLTPGDKVVRTELNVGSVQKLARVVFMLEILLRNLDIGAVL